MAAPPSVTQLPGHGRAWFSIPKQGEGLLDTYLLLMYLRQVLCADGLMHVLHKQEHYPTPSSRPSPTGSSRSPPQQQQRLPPGEGGWVDSQQHMPHSAPVSASLQAPPKLDITKVRGHRRRSTGSSPMARALAVMPGVGASGDEGGNGSGVGNVLGGVNAGPSGGRSAGQFHRGHEIKRVSSGDTALSLSMTPPLPPVLSSTWSGGENDDSSIRRQLGKGVRVDTAAASSATDASSINATRKARTPQLSPPSLERLPQRRVFVSSSMQHVPLGYSTAGGNRTRDQFRRRMGGGNHDESNKGVASSLLSPSSLVVPDDQGLVVAADAPTTEEEAEAATVAAVTAAALEISAGSSSGLWPTLGSEGGAAGEAVVEDTAGDDVVAFGEGGASGGGREDDDDKDDDVSGRRRWKTHELNRDFQDRQGHANFSTMPDGGRVLGVVGAAAGSAASSADSMSVPLSDGSAAHPVPLEGLLGNDGSVVGEEDAGGRAERRDALGGGVCDEGEGGSGSGLMEEVALDYSELTFYYAARNAARDLPVNSDVGNVDTHKAQCSWCLVTYSTQTCLDFWRKHFYFLVQVEVVNLSIR